MSKWLTRALALLLLGVTPALAQQSGTIQGEVTSAAGEGLAGVVVAATSDLLPQARQAVSGANGDFQLPLLPPGTYHLVTDTPLPFGVPQGWSCTDWGPGRTTVSAWPATFTIADDALRLYANCTKEKCPNRTSLARSTGSRRPASWSASDFLRSSFHTGNLSKGSRVSNDINTLSARLCAWMNMRPPMAAVSSSLSLIHI